jgi:octaprenyl-diphosphate synthase
MLKVSPILEEDLKKVDNLLLEMVSDGGEKMKEVARYIFQSGGKRLRPLLLILTSKLFGYKGEDHIKLASAVEFVHTATLLHDDVIDGAALRRGKPSVNSVWGNEVSILTGDFLFARASKIVHEVRNEKIINLLLTVVEKMVEGEFLQMKVKGNVEEGGKFYFEIIRNKTSRFISACCEIGGILAKVNRKDQERLKEFGLEIGDAFQIVDDVIDFCGDPSIMGKKPGKDIEEGKVTLPLFLAYQNADRKTQNKIKKIMEKTTSKTEREIKWLINLAREKKGIESALQVAREKIENAKRVLNFFPDNIYRRELKNLSEYIINRRA